MGISVLETVQNCLLQAGLPAAAAYPGHKLSRITDTVAAYHIQKVDSSSKSFTVEVTVHSPVHMGGSACEAAALQATHALSSAGAVCIQNGCRYDSLTELYSVSILATFTGEDGSPLPGFQVRISNVDRPWAVAFSAEKVREQTLEYATRSPDGVAITSGACYWKLHLEELVPYGSQETPEPNDDFVLRVIRDTGSEIYKPCRWTSVTRSFTAEGLRLVCKGIALTGKEVTA